MLKILNKHKDIILVSLLFIALLCIVFREVVFSDYIFARRDIARLYLPVREFVVSSIKNLEAPLWNPYLFCGAPLHAGIHHAVFYPPTIIYYIGDFYKGFSLFILFHIFLCGISAYIFARFIRVSKAGSILSGFAFMFSGYVLSTVCLATVLSSLAWFPFVILFFIRGLRQRTYHNAVILGVLLSLLFIAGDPPVFIVTCFLLFVTSVFLFFVKLVKKRGFDVFILYSFIVTSSVFFVLSAFQILPAVEYYSMTIRTAMPWYEASAWSVPYNHLISFIIPYFNEPALFGTDFLAGQKWLDNYYIGIIPVLLGLIAIFKRKDRKVVWFLFFLCVFSIAISLGRNFVLFPYLYKIIPGFNLVRYPVRFMFIFTFSVCVLSGIGLDCLQDIIKGSRSKAAGIVFLTGGFLTAIIAILIMSFPNQIMFFVMRHAGDMFFSDNTFIYAGLFNLRRTLFYISGFGLFVFLYSRANKKHLVVIPVFLLAVLDILLANTGYNFIEKADYFKRPTENIRYVMKDSSLFRIFASPYAQDKTSMIRGESFHESVEISKDLFASNRMMEFGIYDAWGYDSSKLNINNEIARLIYRLKEPNDNNLLNLLNVKYIASHDRLGVYGYKKVNKTQKASIYLNTRYLPRAMLLSKAIVFDNDKDMLDYMASRRFNPKKEILFKGNIPYKDTIAHDISSNMKSVSRKPGKDRADILKYRPRLVEIDVCSREGAFLFLSDTYYPGWRAYIDDKDTEIYQANFFARAVKIPRGSYRVKFVYAPLSFRAGAVISVIGCFALILYIILACLRLTKK